MSRKFWQSKNIKDVKLREVDNKLSLTLLIEQEEKHVFRYLSYEKISRRNNATGSERKTEEGMRKQGEWATSEQGMEPKGYEEIIRNRGKDFFYKNIEVNGVGGRYWNCGGMIIKCLQ